MVRAAEDNNTLAFYKAATNPFSCPINLVRGAGTARRLAGLLALLGRGPVLLSKCVCWEAGRTCLPWALAYVLLQTKTTGDVYI